MPPPPPPPPPPGPPPPPAPALSKLGGGGAKPVARNQLLSEIQTGTKLKKTKTNDRSAPVIGGNVSGGGSSAQSSSAANGTSSSSTPLKLPGGGAPGGLFAGGLPGKPSDNKKRQQSPSNGLHQPNGVVGPAGPRFPPPSVMSNGGSPPPVANNGAPGKWQPRPPAPSSTNKPRPPALPRDTTPPTNGRSDSAHGERQSSEERQASAVSVSQMRKQFNQPGGSPAASVGGDSAAEQRRASLTSGTSRPGQAPPQPPPGKAKPALPTVAPTPKPAGQQIHRRTDFQTMRPIKQNASTFGQPPLRRAGSSEDVRAPPPPPRPPNRPAPLKPNGPPPPPPPAANHKPAFGTPQSFGNSNGPVQHRMPPVNTRPPSEEVPPPPPPRESSYGTTPAVSSAFEQRFHFVPLTNLPPPDPFSRSRKVYEAPTNRRNAPQVPHMR